MSRLTKKIDRLEAKQAPPELFGVFMDFGKGELEKQRQEFVENHGREPDNCIVVRFV